MVRRFQGITRSCIIVGIDTDNEIPRGNRCFEGVSIGSDGRRGNGLSKATMEKYERACNIRRICCSFPTGIKPDYIVLRRIYLGIEKLLASSLRALS